MPTITAPTTSKMIFSHLIKIFLLSSITNLYNIRYIEFMITSCFLECGAEADKIITPAPIYSYFAACFTTLIAANLARPVDVLE